VSLILIVLARAAVPIRSALRSGSVPAEGRDPFIAGTGAGAGHVQLCGFESATTLGNEAREPLKTIPRAVLQCAILAGVFFMLCSYSEVLGFRGESSQLSDSTSPLHLLATKAGISPLGLPSTWARRSACLPACWPAPRRRRGCCCAWRTRGCCLQCWSGPAQSMGRRAWPCTERGLMFAMTAALALRGVSGRRCTTGSGSLSVFGFLTAYALVAAALPFARRALGQHSHWVAR
jgi:hypothetical protein